MTNAKDLISAICESHDGPPEDLPVYIGVEYQNVLGLRKKLQVLSNRRAIAARELQEALAEINQEVRELRQSCPHWVTTFYPDASGNNDSSTECNTCGAEL